MSESSTPEHVPPSPPTEGRAAFAGRPRSVRLGEALRTILLSVAIAIVVRVGIAQAYEVEGPSMEPTLVDGQRLLVERCAYGLTLPGMSDALFSWATPKVGDVVIVESTVDNIVLVKRVVGRPGDMIAVRDDIVYRNGVPLKRFGPARCDPERFRHYKSDCERFRESTGQRSWVTSTASDAPRFDELPVRVPPGDIFVMGDHRDRSNDSRFFGPLPISRLRGRVLFVN